MKILTVLLLLLMLGSFANAQCRDLYNCQVAPTGLTMPNPLPGSWSVRIKSSFDEDESIITSSRQTCYLKSIWTQYGYLGDVTYVGVQNGIYNKYFNRMEWNWVQDFSANPYTGLPSLHYEGEYTFDMSGVNESIAFSPYTTGVDTSFSEGWSQSSIPLPDMGQWWEFESGSMEVTLAEDVPGTTQQTMLYSYSITYVIKNTEGDVTERFELDFIWNGNGQKCP